MYMYYGNYYWTYPQLLTVGGCGFQRAQSGIVEGVSRAIIFRKIMHTEYARCFIHVVRSLGYYNNRFMAYTCTAMIILCMLLSYSVHSSFYFILFFNQFFLCFCRLSTFKLKRSVKTCLNASTRNLWRPRLKVC